MGVIRPIDYEYSEIDFFATAALFCGIATTVIMLRFKGFRASMDIGAKKKHAGKLETSSISTTGVYRVYGESPIYNGNIPTQSKISVDMVKLPPSNNETPPTHKQKSKSTGNLAQPVYTEANTPKNTPDVTNNKVDPKKQLTPKQMKEQERENKKKIEEQKRKDKIFIAKVLKEDRERVQREIQLNKEREKAQKAEQINAKKAPKQAALPKPHQTAQLKPNESAKPKSNQTAQLKPNESAKPKSNQPAQPKPNQPAQLKPNQSALPIPIPPPQPKSNQPVQTKPNQEVQRRQKVRTQHGNYSTNTLESSISRTSGPPPYSERKPETIPSKNDNTGNTSFSAPLSAASSWDMISQHREQLSRPTGVSVNMRPRQQNLEYSVGRAPFLGNENENSDA